MYLKVVSNKRHRETMFLYNAIKHVQVCVQLKIVWYFEFLQCVCVQDIYTVTCSRLHSLQLPRLVTAHFVTIFRKQNFLRSF